MKKLYTLLFIAATSASFAQLSDGFTGTGTLISNGWTKHSGTEGQLTIATGSLSYTGLNATGNKVALVAGNSEDVNKPSAAALTGLVYYSAVLNVPNTTGLHPNTATGDYFLAASSAVGAANTAFQARIYVRTGSAADTFNLGVLNNSGGTAAPTFVPTDFAVNVPVFVVVKYDLSTNTASLYINPAIGSSEGTADATNATGTTAAPASILSMAIRQGGSAATGTGNVEIDELRLNSTWASVTSASLGVKENAIAGLKVYPNPLTGNTLFIDTYANAEKSVVVYDVLGKVVLNTKTASNAVNVSKLNTGVYVVKITEEGNTATRKLVIK